MARKLNVNITSVMIDPKKHIGQQLRDIREKKGYTGQQAMEEYNKLVPEEAKLGHRVSYYQRERKDDVGLKEVALMMKSIGIVNIMIDDA